MFYADIKTILTVATNRRDKAGPWTINKIQYACITGVYR